MARKRGRGADGEAGWGKADEVESDMHDEKSQALLVSSSPLLSLCPLYLMHARPGEAVRNCACGMVEASFVRACNGALTNISTQDKEAQDARAMWRTAPKELVKDGSDEFDEYFTGMFP